MRIPDRATACAILREGEARNPGAWVAHSINAARAAQCIAEQIDGMDAQAAYTLGLLHDIGRREGITDMRHIIDGYRYLYEQGYEDSARICLTHSFPLQDVRTMDSNWDGTAEDRDFIAAYLDRIEYTPYDRLIQLCDAIAISKGFCLIEKRLVEVAMRRGINELTVAKWKAFFDVKQMFEKQIGRSVYTLLPGIVETTFGFAP